MQMYKFRKLLKNAVNVVRISITCFHAVSHAEIHTLISGENEKGMGAVPQMDTFDAACLLARSVSLDIR